MGTTWLYALSSTMIVSMISLIGIVTVGVNIDKLRRIIFILVSLAVGSLFGDAFIHLIPEAFEQNKDTRSVALGILGGILFFFLIEKFIRLHHDHTDEEEHISSVGYMNIIANGVHNFIDGLLIGISYLANIEIGIATTIAVVAHEIPHEISEFGVLIHSGFTKRKALIYNFLSASISFIGTTLVLIIGNEAGAMIKYLIPFAAGGFVYIAGSNLIPELHKESKIKKSAIQIIAIIFGISTMMLMK